MPHQHRAELTATLKSAPLFSGLDAALFADFVASARIVELERGQALFAQHDRAMAFFVVLDGWVKIFRVTPRGDEAVIGVFTRGESFAEIAALAGEDYPANAEAVTDVRVAMFPVDHLVRRIADDPQIALTMLASISRQVRRLIDEIEQMKGLSGIQRVAEFLAAQCTVEKGTCAVRLPYEKSLIAAKLGMKAESLSRVFQRLRNHGVVISRDMAVISEVSSLRDIVEQDRGSAAL
jgi:CRP-like cAMP-binding protein